MLFRSAEGEEHMNPVIRQLAIEADAWYDQNRIEGAPDQAQWEMKFAELIIEETLAALGSILTTQVYELVKQHFGEPDGN